MLVAVPHHLDAMVNELKLRIAGLTHRQFVREQRGCIVRQTVNGKVFPKRILMKRLLCINQLWLLILLLLFVGVGCGSGNDTTDPTQQDIAVESEESDYILGQWEVNNGRFGHKIFNFQADGRLLIEDIENASVIEMRYVFVEATSLILSGYDDFNGAATVAFFDDKMDLTITFEGDIFAELYVFTRLPEATD